MSEDTFSDVVAHMVPFRCPDECYCVGYAVDCTRRRVYVNSSLNISSNTRLLDMSNNPDLFSIFQPNEQAVQNLGHLNISSCDITNITIDFLTAMKNLIFLDLRYNRIEIIAYGLFKNQGRLNVLLLDGNTELMVIETHAFVGLQSLAHLHLTNLKIEHIEKGAFSSLHLEMLSINNSVIHLMDDNVFENLVVGSLSIRSDILSFSDDMFAGIESVDTIISEAYKFCCIKPDFLPESNCYPHKDEFSSCEDLMRNEVLRALIWIIGVFALLGNSLTLLYRLFFDRARLKLSYGIFVSNLALSDFLMGVYLIIIGSADVSFRGTYIFSSETWKSSAWCKMAGVLSAMSSECSILLMCMITLDRIFVIKFPFGQVRIRQKMAYSLISIVWLVAFFIAILPVFYTSYFKDSFYSKSGVCLALPLTRDKPPGWQYSVGLFIGFNSITFILIAFGQYLIFKEVRSSKKVFAGKRSARTNDLKIARNLLLVVSTDFFCWFPIGILGKTSLHVLFLLHIRHICNVPFCPFLLLLRMRPLQKHNYSTI